MTCLITALDFPEAETARELAFALDPTRTRLKIGNELFTAAGPVLVEELQGRGFEIFLDLKYHDIPNTVGAAVARAAALGVWMVNVHASGGRRMLDAARESVERCQGERGGTRLIAVTVLTSLERRDLMGIGLDTEPALQVDRLARLSHDAGLDGVVCSAQEIERIRGGIPGEFLLVTPGIRPAIATADAAGGGTPPSDDQRRTMSPAAAIRAGADHLVIGRPVTRAARPLDALAAIAAECDTAWREHRPARAARAAGEAGSTSTKGQGSTAGENT